MLTTYFVEHNTRKLVIPFLPSRLVERPLRHTVSRESNHLERMHHRLREEQEHRCQERAQPTSSSSPQQEVESGRHPSSVSLLVAPPAPPKGTPAARGELDRDDNGDSSSHNMELSEEQELEGRITRPITRDTARGCDFHDALNTMLCRSFDQHTRSIEYRCLVYQHSRGTYPNRWESTCLVRRPVDDL
jgi:hypothetical protein